MNIFVSPSHKSVLQQLFKQLTSNLFNNWFYSILCSSVGLHLTRWLLIINTIIFSSYLSKLLEITILRIIEFWTLFSSYAKSSFHSFPPIRDTVAICTVWACFLKSVSHNWKYQAKSPIEVLWQITCQILLERKAELSWRKLSLTGVKSVWTNYLQCPVLFISEEMKNGEFSHGKAIYVQMLPKSIYLQNTPR